MRSEYVQLTLVSQNLSLHTALNTSVTFVNQKLVIIVFSNKLLFFFFWQKHKLNKNWCMRTKTILALLPTNANKMKIFWRDGIQSELKLSRIERRDQFGSDLLVQWGWSAHLICPRETVQPLLFSVFVIVQVALILPVFHENGTKCQRLGRSEQ